MTMLLYCFVISIAIEGLTQATVEQSPEFLARECYENDYLLQRDNRLPHTMNTFLALLRKIENIEGLNMDLRTLSVALLHRFRQDGIGQNPSIRKQDGVTPYAPIGFQYFRNLKTLRLIPGNAISFPNNSITALERCTLHFMLSSSIEIYERGDEGTVCRFSNSAYRQSRSIAKTSINQRTIFDDVETLSPEQIKVMTKNREDFSDDGGDPNSLYPELPPNHPDVARMSVEPPLSKCPVENGVIRTEWGTVSMGPVLAGIAAALEHQDIPLTKLFQDNLQDSVDVKTFTESTTLDNKWIATLAGDLAEVALRQGPTEKLYSMGISGSWNSTILPRWYFLNSNENLELTEAEIRGDLDGLILAHEIGAHVTDWDSKFSGLRLSQVLDMYYSERGLFNTNIRACNRRALFTSVAPNSTMSAQAFSAGLVLSKYLAKATLTPQAIEKFAVQAIRKLSTYIPTQMTNTTLCKNTDTEKIYNIKVDLTIILDTNWPFTSIQRILTTLLENIEIHQYNSNFTIINGYDGNTMINSSSNILDFYNYNASHYNNETHGFDLPKSIKVLKWLQYQKLNKERDEAAGGARSDVVLIIPYTSSISESDKEYCIEQLRKMREDVPDTIVLYLTYGSKDRWSNIALNSTSDLLSVGTGNADEEFISIQNLISKIKQVPKRLINTQCGANYVALGSSKPYIGYIAPYTMNIYKLHPNYFFKTDTSSVPTIKIQGSGSGILTACTSRDFYPINYTETSLSISTCTSISNNLHSITLPCFDASTIHECPPFYLWILSNSSISSYKCSDHHVCRFPDEIKYTISYENLVCTSTTSRIILQPIIYFLFFIYFTL